MFFCVATTYSITTPCKVRTIETSYAPRSHEISRSCRFPHASFDISLETRNESAGGADMTRHNTSESLKSVSGGTFVGLGLHILSGNLSGDATRLRDFLDMPAGDALGVLPSIALAASRASKAYALDQARFLDSLLCMLTSLWPLLLIIAGTLLLRKVLADTVEPLPARDKYFQNRETGCRFHCPSFDA